MSETFAALQVLKSLAERIGARGVALPAESQCARLVRALGAESVSVTPPSNFLEELRVRLVTTCRSGALGTLSARDRRYAPWLLWNGDPQAATLPGLLDAVLQRREAREARCGG